LSAAAQGVKDHIAIIRLANTPVDNGTAESGHTASGLRAKLSLWHGTKLGLGGLSVLTSITNTTVALNQFTNDDQSVLVNSLNVTGNLLGIGGSGHGLKAAVLSRQRDIAATTGREVKAKALRSLVERADRLAIGLVAAASLVTALRDLSARVGKGEREKHISQVGIALQGASAGVGFAFVGAKIWTHKVGLAGRNFALQKAGQSIAPFVGRAAIWFADAPVALIMSAFQLAYAWNQSRIGRAKVTDWISRGCLGREPALDGLAEQQQYYELLLEPKIETRSNLGNIVLDAAIPRYEPLRPQREVEVLLPGWQPQVSAYALTQYVAFGLMKESQLSDPAKVILKNGNGYLRLEAHNLLGNTVVRYWPNGFTRPDLMLETTH
jgi:hypothetical protein